MSTVEISAVDSWTWKTLPGLKVKQVKAGGEADFGTKKVRILKSTKRAKGSVKTSSKAAVRTAYRKGYAANVRYEKVVKVNGCKAAVTPKAVQKRQVKAMNFFRSMVGVAPVKLNAGLSAKAAQAALIQNKQGFLDHYPVKRAGTCWTKAGMAASSASNLSYGYIGARNIAGYVEDSGAHNYQVGHRRWIMDPQLTKVGTGYAGDFNALHVGAAGKASNPSPVWIQWPSKGYFPSELEPDERWSFMSSRSDVNFAKAKVTVTVGKKKLSTKVLSRDPAPSAGMSMIMGHQWGMTWNVKNLPKVKKNKTVTAKVKVTGLRLRNGTKLPTVNYSVKLFNAGP